MRSNLTRSKLEAFMKELARNAHGNGNVYFTGGATALLLEMREQTIDVDIKFDPEPKGAFEALGQLKDKLDLNVELASPVDFIPVAADWKERSPFIGQIGSIGFYHFDLAAQALSKIERGHGQDLEDARGFLAFAKIAPQQLWSYFLQTKPGLARYPALDAASFAIKVKRFLGMP
jgi:hypothetical protein